MANTYTKILRQGTYAEYLAIAVKDANLLYFCTDNGKLFKGEVDFTNSFVEVLSTALPATGVPGKIYHVTDQGKFKYWNGTGYVEIGNPIDAQGASDTSTITAVSADDHVPSSKNVYTYGQEILAQAIGGDKVVKSIAAGDEAAEFTYTKGDDTTVDVVVPGVVTAATAGSNAGQVSFTNSTAASSNTVTVPGVATTITPGTDPGAVVLSKTTGDPVTAVVPGVGKTLAAGTDAGTIALTKTSGASDVVTIPGVATNLEAGTDAAEIVYSQTTGAGGSVVVPGVVTGISNKSGSDATVTITKSTGAAADLTINGVVTTPTWNATARILQLPVAGGSTVEVNIGKDIFLDPTGDHHYDAETHELVLYLNDGAGGTPTEIRIPVQGMIPVYSGGSTSTATTSIANNLVITTAVKLDQHAGNAITIAEDTKEGDVVTTAGGLRVDLSDYALNADLEEVADNLDALAAATTAWGTFTE